MNESRLARLEILLAHHEQEAAKLKHELELLRSKPQSRSDAASDQKALAHDSTNWPYELLPADYQRYGRQMVIPGFGVDGQLRLRDASVLIVGLGGLGCPAAAYLAGAGIGKIGLIDGDTVDRSNLHRQILHSEARIGSLKVESARETLLRINPHLRYECYGHHLQPETAVQLFEQYDMILDCTDQPMTRYLISDAAVLAGRPLVSASALRTDGQLLLLNFPFYPSSTSAKNINGAHHRGPCYRCIFPRPPPAESVQPCNEGGILGPVVGTMGVLMALESIKYLTGLDSSSPFSDLKESSSKPSSSMLIFSATSGSMFRTVRLRGPSPECVACSGSSATLTREQMQSGALDYAAFCGSLSLSPAMTLEPHERIQAAHYLQMREGALQGLHPQGPSSSRPPNNCHDQDSLVMQPILIDVRPPEQFAISSLSGSINVPIDDLLAMKQASDLAETLQRSVLTAYSAEGSVKTDAVVRSQENLLGAQEQLDGSPESSTPEIIAICRLGHDSQRAVRKMQSLSIKYSDLGRQPPRSQSPLTSAAESASEPASQAASDHPADRSSEANSAIRIRDVRGGFAAWRQLPGVAWPDFI